MQRIAVIGAGTMGLGIAQTCAQNGFVTLLIDIDPQKLHHAVFLIKENLNKGVQKGKLSNEQRDETLTRIQTGTALSDAASAHWVIEAIPESLAQKRAIFAELERVVSSQTVLASNTSSLSITQIAAHTQHPDRVIGLHFFNPVPVMQLLEIVVSPLTKAEVLQEAQALAALLKKKAIVVKDSPGFATSRLGLALGLEAIRMLQSKVASIEDIDQAMKLGYGHPMGPLQLTDWVGLDVRLAIAQSLHQELGSESFKPPALLERMVRDGLLGRKSGKGFYHWENGICLGPS